MQFSVYDLTAFLQQLTAHKIHQMVFYTIHKNTAVTNQKKNNTNKLVGFYGLIAPPVPNARSLECPWASIAARRRAAHSITISRQASCCSSNVIAGIAIGQTSKCISSVTFLRIESKFFFTIHRRHRRKKTWWTRILKYEFCDFLDFFWNFQKGVVRSLCGWSGPLWSRPN